MKPEKKNLPIKTITYQNIYLAKDTLTKLQSWEEILKVLGNFFSYDQQKEAPNKKEIMRTYHANAQVFESFLTDFYKQTNILEKQLEELRTKEKVNDV